MVADLREKHVKLKRELRTEKAWPWMRVKRPYEICLLRSHRLVAKKWRPTGGDRETDFICLCGGGRQWSETWFLKLGIG